MERKTPVPEGALEPEMAPERARGPEQETEGGTPSAGVWYAGSWWPGGRPLRTPERAAREELEKVEEVHTSPREPRQGAWASPPEAPRAWGRRVSPPPLPLLPLAVVAAVPERRDGAGPVRRRRKGGGPGSVPAFSLSSRI